MEKIYIHIQKHSKLYSIERWNAPWKKWKWKLFFFLFFILPLLHKCIFQMRRNNKYYVMLLTLWLHTINSSIARTSGLAILGYWPVKSIYCYCTTEYIYKQDKRQPLNYMFLTWAHIKCIKHLSTFQ